MGRQQSWRSASVAAPDLDPTGAASVALVKGILSDSPSALHGLYELMERSARPFLRRSLDSSDTQVEVEDRLHNAWLAAVEAIRTGALRDPTRLVPFVQTIARYQAIAGLRAAVRRRRHLEPTVVPLVDERSGPEQAREQTEQREVLAGMLDQMRSQDREILERFYLLEEAPAEICRSMQLTETQFRLRKSRAKARLTALALRPKLPRGERLYLVRAKGA